MIFDLGSGGLEIKERLAEWTRKAIKESHADEMEYHNRSLKELDSKHKQAQERLDALYDGKLDGRIAAEFYQRKFEQYQGELNAIQNRRGHHQIANATRKEHCLASPPSR